jgi:predicted DNA-binding transcriptional regulator AlpA
MAEPLLSDGDLASLIKMSRSWIRKQRMLRRAGLPHVLAIDPIMIGSRPRYCASEVETWIEETASLR